MKTKIIFSVITYRPNQTQLNKLLSVLKPYKTLIVDNTKNNLGYAISFINPQLTKCLYLLGMQKQTPTRIIMSSMTPQEIKNPEIILKKDQIGRIVRIARGAGVSKEEVKKFIIHFSSVKTGKITIPQQNMQIELEKILYIDLPKIGGEIVDEILSKKIYADKNEANYFLRFPFIQKEVSDKVTKAFEDALFRKLIEKGILRKE